MSIIYPSIPTDNFATKQSNNFSGSQSVTGAVHVSGTIETTTGGIKFPDGSIQTVAATGVTTPLVLINPTSSDPALRIVGVDGYPSLGLRFFGENPYGGSTNIIETSNLTYGGGVGAGTLDLRSSNVRMLASGTGAGVVGFGSGRQQLIMQNNATMGFGTPVGTGLSMWDNSGFERGALMYTPSDYFGVGYAGVTLLGIRGTPIVFTVDSGRDATGKIDVKLDSAGVLTSNQASGSDAFAIANNGARLHLGAGSNDYIYSDGTRIITPAHISASAITASVGGVKFPDGTIQTTAIGEAISIGTPTNGLNYSSGILTIATASLTTTGVITTGSQELSGTKYFADGIISNNSIDISWYGDQATINIRDDGYLNLRGTSGLLGVSIGASFDGYTGSLEVGDNLVTIRDTNGSQWSTFDNSTKNVMITGTLNVSGALGTTQINTWNKPQVGYVTVLSSTSNTASVNLGLSNNYKLPMTENTLLQNPTNSTEGQSGLITISQPAGANYSLSYDTFWKFPSGSVKDLTATNGAIDALAYYVSSGSSGLFAICNLLGNII
jgi:hypothetical protein